MSRIKDDLEEKKELANKELEASEPKNAYQFIDENGEHMHTLRGQPLIGTSTVSSVIAKPLTWWSAGLAVAKLGWIHKGDKEKGWTKKELRLEKAEEMREKIEYMSSTDYLDLLDEAYAAHSKKLKSSAQQGTDLHSILEIFIKARMSYDATGSPESVNLGIQQLKQIEAFVTWSVGNVKRFLWSEMYCYSEKMWTGGISDCGYEAKDGTYGIMDFKSSKEAYPSQFWQCAGYHLQIEENGGFDKNGNKIFILDKPITEYAIFPFGMENPEPQFNVDIQGCQEAFKSEVILYKKLN